MRARILVSATVAILLTGVGWLAGAFVGLTTTDWHSSAEWFWRDVHTGTAAGFLLGLFVSYTSWARDGE